MRTWSPDTCGCTVEEIYNGTDIVGMGEVIKKCAAHATVPDNELYGVLYTNPDSEQKRKNLLYKHLVETETGKDLPEGGRGLADGVKYNWSFTGKGKNRILEVFVDGITAKQTKDIKTHVNNQFGEKISIKNE